MEDSVDASPGTVLLDRLAANIAEVLNELAAIAEEEQQMCERELAGALGKLDRAIYCLAGVFMPAFDRWGREQRESIWRDAAPKRASPTFVFCGVLVNVINSALAARRLVATGMDRQARAVFRELTEVGDLLLAIVGDEALLDRYLESPEDDDRARDHWDKHLRPWRIREHVKRLARQHGIDRIWTDAEAMWRARWDLYAWLSKSAHVDYTALVVQSVAADRETRYNFNLGGRVGPHSEGTLQRLGDYLQDLLIILSLFLAAQHRWTRDDPVLHEPLLVVRAYAETYSSAAGSS